ncbi:MAG: hypothetical protein JST39_10940, partial [Bacteroidetes bacterium]|nr:hypothetical protein [Bacteroidota bacterium]
INNYTVDANNYVQQFGVGGDDFAAITFWSGLGLYSSTKYTLSYNCY